MSRFAKELRVIPEGSVDLCMVGLCVPHPCGCSSSLHQRIRRWPNCRAGDKRCWFTDFSCSWWLGLRWSDTSTGMRSGGRCGT